MSVPRRGFSLSLRRPAWADRSETTLQALVYDILPSTTAVFSYAIGSRKLSANEFFVGAQTVVSSLQNEQIIKRRLFYCCHVAYAQLK